MNGQLDLCAQQRSGPGQPLDWNALYGDLLPRVYNYFRYRVGDGPEAEDLTSTTFEKAWRARKRYRRDRGGFSTWLFTIARNVAIDALHRSRPLYSLEEVEGQGTVVSAGEPSPEAAAIRRDELERLGVLLAGLSARERELVALKYGAGLTNRSIARLVTLSESNVGTILYRVVCKLRAQWEQTDE